MTTSQAIGHQNPGPPTPIKPVWRAFVAGLKVLMVVDPDNRPLDQFLPVRDHALGMVQSELFENELEKAWFNAGPGSEVHAGLVVELGAVPRAIEVAQATGSKLGEQNGWRKRLLGISSTVLGSLKDILEGYPHVKSGLMLLQEGVDIFRG